MRPRDRRAAIAGLSIDTRTIRPGEAFLALRGERFDGHDFVREAVDRGAAIVIVEADRQIDLPRLGVGVLETPNAAGALAAIATAHRRSLTDAKVVCITGSNGKTTTCRLLHAALSARLPGVVSAKSFNNHIGLPLTLLRATPEHRFVICEAGTSGPGEIAALTAIALPDVAVITSVGRAHLEGLIDLAGVAREKASIARGLGPAGRLIASADSPELLAELAGPALAGRTITFGRSEGARHRVASIERATVNERDGVSFLLDGARFEVALEGEHNACNAAAAILAARALGLDDGAIRGGLLLAAPPPMRLERRTVGGVTVINDAYNANPESMAAAAAAFLARAPAEARRVLIVGDMLELGAGAIGAHEETGRRIGAMGRVDLMCCVGGLARSIGAGLARAQPGARVEAFDAEAPETAAHVAALLGPGDWALLKGSRGMRLERVEEALRDGAADAPSADGARCSSIS